LGNFNKEVSKHKLEIYNLYTVIQKLGLSRNKDLNDFIHIFVCVITLMDNLKYYENQDFNNKMTQYYIKDILRDIKVQIEQINQGLTEWEKKLKITKQDYQDINIEY